PKDNPFPTGSLVGRAAGEPASADDADAWHAFHIKLESTTVSVELDGKRIPLAKFEHTPVPPRGRIGLQFNDGPVAFRNIRLKPLGLKPLFNGRDLSGWNTDRADQSEFSVTEAGEIAVRNGPGQLETDDTFGDFVLQLDCR